MGEVPGVLLKRILRGAGGYELEGGRGERRSLCGEGYRVVEGRTGWEGG